MKLIHCLTHTEWIKQSPEIFYVSSSLQQEGFIHCSTAENFRFIASSFKENKEALCFLVIDPQKVTAPIRWEDGSGNGILYPHIYGALNKEAIISVVPYLTDSAGNWFANQEML